MRPRGGGGGGRLLFLGGSGVGDESDGTAVGGRGCRVQRATTVELSELTLTFQHLKLIAFFNFSCIYMTCTVLVCMYYNLVK